MRLPRGSLRGEVDLPGDKSISHRALILRAFLGGDGPIENCNPGRDVDATKRGLESLFSSSGTRERAAIDCANSGSTARMLLGVCAGARLSARFDGDESLRRRPMEPVAAQLRAFGARIETSEGHLPLDLWKGESVQTRSFILLSPSAQVKSALLFAALFAGVCIDITGDRGSRDHTERLLRFQGAGIEWDGQRIALSAPPSRRLPMRVAGDFSAAAFFITGAVINAGSAVTTLGACVNPTRTGLLDVLRSMGASVELHNERDVCGEPVADVTARYSRLHSVDIDKRLALRAIDEIPLVAVAAAFAHGTSVIRGIGDLRTKESDRVSASVELLRAVGIEATADADTLTVAGGEPAASGTIVRSHEDHRIAMAAAILGAAAGPLELDDASSAAVSFPEFVATLERTRVS